MHHPIAAPAGGGQDAVLALADGTVFRGSAVGALGAAAGEVVFNTAMTGYQEILSDPSYARQLITFTYPHIGNTGVNGADGESARVHAAGMIVSDVPRRASNWRAAIDLGAYLRQQNVVAIAGIDTRMLTHLLRGGGAQAGAIVTALADPDGRRVDGEDDSAALASRAVALARACGGLAGIDLARTVSCAAPYVFCAGQARQPGTTPLHVVAYDFGIKANILRMLATRGCQVTVVPASTCAAAALALRPDGVFLSNGPGDPAPCDYAIAAARTLIDAGVPTFGICLGHQLIALASGARTVKMAFGHHGANHPVRELASGKVAISSQNHGFAVDAASLPANCRITHLSLFDGSLQGFARSDRPAFGFQGHPEAAPGPHDLGGLFDQFITLMEHTRHAQAF